MVNISTNDVQACSNRGRDPPWMFLQQSKQYLLSVPQTPAPPDTLDIFGCYQLLLTPHLGPHRVLSPLKAPSPLSPAAVLLMAVKSGCV